MRRSQRHADEEVKMMKEHSRNKLEEAERNHAE